MQPLLFTKVESWIIYLPMSVCSAIPVQKCLGTRAPWNCCGLGSYPGKALWPFTGTFDVTHKDYYIERIIVFWYQTCTPIILRPLGLPWLQQPSHFQGIILVGDTSTFWSIILVGDISAFRSIILVWDTLAFWGIILAGDISAFLLVRLLGQCFSNGRNDVLVGVLFLELLQLS